MTNLRYFVVGTVAGSPHTRYAVLNGRTAEVQISRPEGVEVPAPAQVRFMRPQFSGGALASPSFGTVRGEALAQARLRAAEKGKRALAERRSLMSTETDAKLAQSRSRGAFTRAA